MWIVWRNYKPNLFQIAELDQIVGDDQMPDMNGIERPEEKSYFFWNWFYGGKI